MNTELVEAQRAGAALLEDVLEKVRIEKGEGWSPVPVIGFRGWRLMNGLLYGAKVVWQRPEMSADCLHLVAGEDLPHSAGKCGPPPCGIYAVKELAVLKRELGPWGSSSLFGVVAMTGKVIEHDLGYRAAKSKVVAITGRIGGKRTMDIGKELRIIEVEEFDDSESPVVPDAIEVKVEDTIDAD